MCGRSPWCYSNERNRGSKVSRLLEETKACYDDEDDQGDIYDSINEDREITTGNSGHIRNRMYQGVYDDDAIAMDANLEKELALMNELDLDMDR